MIHSRSIIKVLISLPVVALMFILTSCVPYRKASFKGPATVTDSGFFSYYRYHFEFSPPLSLHEPGRQTYRFRGMPKDPMTIWFAVEPFQYKNRTEVSFLTTVLSVELRDDRGILLCSGEGSLSGEAHGVPQEDAQGTAKDDRWILAAGGDDAEFWRPSCTGVKFTRNRTYILNVRVDQIDPRTPSHMSITPWIDGGGNELP